ncbi:hypothetical protein JXB28_01320 [Candidatus Woesearchaeota archaeon]|nr:hypothetical protein [Candidatus Woesearchaeota archaeon]
MDKKTLDEMDRKLRQKEKCQRFRAAAISAQKDSLMYSISGAEKFSILQLLAIGNWFRAKDDYNGAGRAYWDAIRQTTSPGEPHVILKPKERGMAMTRLERLVKDIMGDQAIAQLGTDEQAARYKCAREAMDTLRYYHR